MCSTAVKRLCTRTSSRTGARRPSQTPRRWRVRLFAGATAVIALREIHADPGLDELACILRLWKCESARAATAFHRPRRYRCSAPVPILLVAVTVSVFPSTLPILAEEQLRSRRRLTPSIHTQPYSYRCVIGYRPNPMDARRLPGEHDLPPFGIRPGNNGGCRPRGYRRNIPSSGSG